MSMHIAELPPVRGSGKQYDESLRRRVLALSSAVQDDDPLRCMCFQASHPKVLDETIVERLVQIAVERGLLRGETDE
jgi:hypothetical protein